MLQSRQGDSKFRAGTKKLMVQQLIQWGNIHQLTKLQQYVHLLLFCAGTELGSILLLFFNIQVISQRSE